MTCSELKICLPGQFQCSFLVDLFYFFRLFWIRFLKFLFTMRRLCYKCSACKSAVYLSCAQEPLNSHLLLCSLWLLLEVYVIYCLTYTTRYRFYTLQRVKSTAQPACRLDDYCCRFCEHGLKLAVHRKKMLLMVGFIVATFVESFHSWFLPPKITWILLTEQGKIPLDSHCTWLMTSSVA